MTDSKTTRTLFSLAIALFSSLSFAQDAEEAKPVRGEDFIRVPAIGEGLSVSNVFQSNMVIQRDKPVTIWGWAAPDEKVTVSFAGQSAEATAAADRAWTVTLDALPANTAAQELVVKGASETLTLENVLVGDVWVLGGQSNMEFDLSKVDDGFLEVASANFPEIRLLTAPRGKGFDSVPSFERLHEWSDWSSRHFQKGDWEICSPETVREFSAIGYVFGRRLHMASGVPIGLVDASVGGTTVETWTPQDVIAKIEGEETKALLRRWEEKIAAWDAEADLQKRIENHERNKADRAKHGDPLPPDSKPPSDLKPGPIADQNRPGYCYASMIRPLEGLAVKGAVWHQGFNNCFNGSEGARMYYQVFGKMIGAWRAAFGDEQLPFCVISQCTAGEPQTEDNFLTPMYDVGALIREAQHKTYRDLRDAGDENIGFASSFDLRKSWYHPQIKVPAGERAAKWALATQSEILTGRDAPLYWTPPAIEEVVIEGGTIRLQFNTEIRTQDDSDGRMSGFGIAGDDRVFHPAQVDYFADGVDDRNRPKLKKNILVLSHPSVEVPRHYRYAWARNPMANLGNRFGIPIATQRSDDWILEETPARIEPPESMDPDSVQRWLSGQQRSRLQTADIERRYADAQATVDELGPAVRKARAERFAPVKHMIDTHIHLYDTTRDIEMRWPPADDDVLHKPHMPAEYSRVAKAVGVTGVVIVEASDHLEDNDWVLKQVSGDDFYVGLVGNIDVNREDFGQQLLRLKKDPRFVGIRPRGADPIDYASERVLTNLRLLAENDLTMDYLTNGGGIPGIETVDAVARAIPELMIVVNHCLGYDFDGEAPPADWVAAVERLAENENVYCKISGLYQRSVPQPAPRDIDHFSPVLEVLWSRFGQDRLVYGSNWPCTKNTGSYASFVALVDQFVGAKGQDAREAYYWKNAAAAYRLPLE